MAFVVGTDTFLVRTTGVVAPTSDYTACWWYRPNAANFARVVFATVDGPGTYSNWIGVFTNAPAGQNDYKLSVSDGVTESTTATVTLEDSTYVAMAYVRQGTAHRFYVNGVLIGTVTYNVSAFDIGQVTVLDFDRGSMQNFREWTNDLTLAELRDEWNSDTPVRTTDLFTNTPLSSNLNDTTANAHTWTVVGLTGFEPSAIAKPTTNSSAATAHMVTLTDTYVQVPAASGGGSQDSWWTHTPVTGVVEIGVFGYAQAGKSYQPQTTIWSGATPTQSSLFGSITNVPCQVPVTAGTAYYQRCRDTTGNDAALTVSWQSAPDSTAAAGSLLINDDSEGFPGVIVSTTTGAPLQFRNPMVAGEAGDAVRSGQVLLSDDFNTNLTLYSNALSTATTIPYTWTGVTPPIRAHLSSGKFYVGNPNGGAAIISTVSSAGAIGGTTWGPLPTTVVGIAVNAAETILYFVAAAANSPIQRWNLSSNTALSDLAAGIAGYVAYDILVLSDDTIVVGYFQTVGHNFQVKHYSAAGATLNTYTFGVVNTPTPRIAYDGLDATSVFWVMFRVSPVEHFQQVRVSDGVILKDLSGAEFEGGVWTGSPETDAPRFGTSKCCPLISLPVPTPPNYSPPTPPGPPPAGAATLERLIPRRVRIAPHLSEQQMWAFHKWLQIDMETGVGLTDTAAQGSDPMITLRWSDDGGHTWSDPYEMGIGQRGEWARRVLFRRLGRSRDRIYWLEMSDPVRANVLAAYLEAEQGLQ